MVATWWFISRTAAEQVHRGFSEDITERKIHEDALRRALKELRSKNKRLEEVNTALEVLLEKRDKDREEFQSAVLSNIKHVVLPYLRKIRNSPSKEELSFYSGIIESHLREIAAPFIGHLSDALLGLTSTEIRLSQLIRDEKTNKEIAGLLGLSANTVRTHRENIRKKLGLTGKRMNLRSYLQSLH